MENNFIYSIKALAKDCAQKIWISAQEEDKIIDLLYKRQGPNRLLSALNVPIINGLLGTLVSISLINKDNVENELDEACKLFIDYPDMESVEKFLAIIDGGQSSKSDGLGFAVIPLNEFRDFIAEAIFRAVAWWGVPEIKDLERIVTLEKLLERIGGPPPFDLDVCLGPAPH